MTSDSFALPSWALAGGVQPAQTAQEPGAPRDSHGPFLLGRHPSSSFSQQIRQSRSSFWPCPEGSPQGARIVSLPECFNSPCGMSCFPENAEKMPSECMQNFSEVERSAACISLEVPSLRRTLAHHMMPVPGLSLMGLHW